MRKHLYLLLDFVTGPKATIELLKQEDYFGYSFFVFAAAFFTQTLGNQLILFTDRAHTPSLIHINFIFSTCVMLTLLVIYIAWIHFSASLLNKPGNIKLLLTAVNLSFVPLFLLFPLGQITAAFIPWPFEFFSALSSMIYLWVIVLFFISVKNTYALSGFQTLSTLTSPLIFIPVFVVLMILGVIIIVFSLR
ncbi:MAG: hypothetical protein A2252_06530 [Elusimicrobia bacterium RIFOXYA2_FULL_39_19]|nr:MAG: hypothetical protein A2252_06530 [Elusimicrobia bacterium RIFOXYA2_FULL_39_19]